MSEWFGQMLSFVATALGLVSMPDAAALGLAIALLAVRAPGGLVRLPASVAGDRRRHPPHAERS
jgi:hypothetical protein